MYNWSDENFTMLHYIPHNEKNNEKNNKQYSVIIPNVHSSQSPFYNYWVKDNSERSEHCEIAERHSEWKEQKAFRIISFYYAINDIIKLITTNHKKSNHNRIYWFNVAIL